MNYVGDPKLLDNGIVFVVVKVMLNNKWHIEKKNKLRRAAYLLILR